MIVIVSLQLFSMKVLVMVETYSGGNKLNPIQWITFFGGWFGMRPGLFEELPSPRLPFASLIAKGLSRIAAGFLLLYLSQLAEGVFKSQIFFVTDLMLLIGLSLILHFGILNLSTALWRFFGVDVRELFRSPYKSTSLQEFWGKRWNLAFSEMTSLVAYKPLKAKIGVRNAMILSFMLSGLLHEIAISVPVHAGYGLPLLYFLLHAAFMQFESRTVLGKKIIDQKLLSHIWVMVALVVPMPLLFHHSFVNSVLRPLRETLLQVFTGF
jgi:alginate O-acetyltransferase complex protein AlgI